MANTRKPIDKARISGADVKNPARYRDRTPPLVSGKIGQPFAVMTPEQRQAWAAFKSELPWLNGSHRAILQVACVLRARLESGGGEVGVNVLQTYSAVLSKLGATPSDEGRVSMPADEDDDPSERFFN